MINKYISAQSIIIFQLFIHWCMIEQHHYSSLGPLNELSSIYGKKANKVSTLKSINQNQNVNEI